MRENLQENLPPPSSDPKRRTELTRSISNSSSLSSSSSYSITMETSKEAPLCYSHATMAAPTEWTNEKHNLYLNSLETSFTFELYHSMRLRDWRPQKNARGTHSSQELSFMTQKINLQRNETLTESTADSHVTMEGPCNASSPTTLTLNNVYASARGSEQNRVCCQDLVGGTTDLSGQNFVDEDESVPKRLKRAASDASSNDQIVPSGNFETKERRTRV